jgi:propanol-preferring alcohol dehydrogenase
MRAAVVTEIPAREFAVLEVAEPILGEEELLVAVEACGICGTDLHILEGSSYRPATPFILGHEPVGVVVAAGIRTNPDLVGRRITITLFVGDGTCAYCAVGDERLCLALNGITGVLGRPGGFADYMTVTKDQVVILPDRLDAIVAATLVDGGATAANAVRSANELLMRAPVVVRDRLVVIVGAGPIGILVAGLMKESGRRVVLVQASPVRRNAASGMGYEVAAALDEIGESPAAVIDCAGAPESLGWALEHLLPRGAFVAAGYGLVPGMSLAPAARKELSVTGVRSGNRHDLIQIMELVAAGSVRPPPATTWPLAAINDAVHALRSRAVPGKAVIVP